MTDTSGAVHSVQTIVEFLLNFYLIAIIVGIVLMAIELMVYKMKKTMNYLFLKIINWIYAIILGIIPIMLIISGISNGYLFETIGPIIVLLIPSILCIYKTIIKDENKKKSIDEVLLTVLIIGLLMFGVTKIGSHPSIHVEE